MEKKERELESELFFNWIDDLRFRNELTKRVKQAKARRQESQKELTKYLSISLTKIKQVEKGTCKDFNAINNYINYFDCSIT